MSGMDRDIFLIVGLGNPGEEYARTRHNAGFRVVDRLADSLGVSWRKRLLLRGQTAEAVEEGRKIVLCEPLTFMNNSGECVRRLVDWYRCPLDRLLVIYDDIDLPPGKIRVRKKGGTGTHNGMRSIAEHLGCTDFPRIRVGTGDRPAGQDLADWVLSSFGKEETPLMEEAFEAAAGRAMIWVREGIDQALQHG